MTAIEQATDILTFDPVSHVYRYDGAVVPNVTRVLEEEGLVDYSHIPDGILRDSQWRGSAVHLACLLDDEGDLDESTVADEHRGYLDAWRKCKRDLRPQILMAEKRLYSPKRRYAGTLDRLVSLPLKQRPQIWDLKTGAPHRSTRLQTAAYANLLGAVTYQYDRFAVRLTKNGGYFMQEHSLSDLSEDFTVFCAALRLNRYKKENR